MTTQSRIFKAFASLKDPRHTKNRLDALIDIIAITLYAVISGAEAWDNVFPWLEAIQEKPGAKVISVDGKTLRRSHDLKNGQSALHLVNALADEASLLLAQMKTLEKSNGIKAIPEFLSLLQLEGSSVTIDAMGCQKDIAEIIATGKADYLLALKWNQEKLFGEVKRFSTQATWASSERTALAEKSDGEWKVRAFVNDLSGGTLSRLEIIGGKYESRGGAHETVLSIPIGEGKKILEGSVPAGYDFYYACLFKEGFETIRAVSAPVWMDND